MTPEDDLRRKPAIIIVATLLLLAAAGIAITVPRLAALAIAGIYLEESGVPMPVPSEVSLGYLGHQLAGNRPALIAAWLGLTMLVVAGATNLVAASRRWGPGLATGRLGTMLHLTPRRLQMAQRWFRRWGPPALVVSRYVPGLRWAMAVACGTLGVSYRAFWLSSAISASIWTGGLLVLGLTVGDAVGRIIAAHPWVILLFPLPAVTVLATLAVRGALGKG
jgi:membrane protein DedA with SNARE-associated domain